MGQNDSKQQPIQQQGAAGGTKMVAWKKNLSAVTQPGVDQNHHSQGPHCFALNAAASNMQGTTRSAGRAYTKDIKGNMPAVWHSLTHLITQLFMIRIVRLSQLLFTAILTSVEISSCSIAFHPHLEALGVLQLRNMPSAKLYILFSCEKIWFGSYLPWAVGKQVRI